MNCDNVDDNDAVRAMVVSHHQSPQLDASCLTVANLHCIMRARTRFANPTMNGSRAINRSTTNFRAPTFPWCSRQAVAMP